MSRLNMKIIILLALFTAACSFSVRAQQDRPVLAGMFVNNLDSSVAWYTKHLSYSLKEKKDYQEAHLRIAILSSGNFELELVQSGEVVSKRELFPKEHKDVTGFAKLTFRVNQVEQRSQQLLKSGAAFAVKLRDSNRQKGEQFFIVLDIDGNWIQFIGDK